MIYIYLLVCCHVYIFVCFIFFLEKLGKLQKDFIFDEIFEKYKKIFVFCFTPFMD